MTSTTTSSLRTGPPTGVRAARPWAGLIDAATVAVVVAVSVWLRMDALGPSSLWLDDAWVALVSRTDGLTELRYVGFSAPGFALLLRTWFGVVGFSETAAQALPFVAGVVAPGAAYVVGRRLGWGRPAALVPALVLATSPMAMDYATRVKQYTTESVLALGIIGVALHLLADVRSVRRWVLLVVAAALATTVSAFLAPYAAAAVAAGLVRARLDRDAVALRRGVVAGLGYGAFAGAWYLGVLAPAVTSSISAFWSGHYLELTDGVAPAIASLRAAAVGVAGGLTALPVAVTLLALGAALAVVAVQRPEHAVLLITPTLVAIVLAGAQVAPLGGGRTDIYLYPSLALLLGAGADVVGRSLPRGTDRALPAVVGIGLAVVTGPVTPYPAQDVRPLVAELERRSEPGDAVLLYPATIWAYALYTPGDIALEREPASSWGFAPRFADPDTHPLPPGRDDPQAYAPTVARVAEEAEQVWLLASHWRDDYDDLQRQLGDAGFELVELERRDGAQLGRWRRS